MQTVRTSAVTSTIVGQVLKESVIASTNGRSQQKSLLLIEKSDYNSSQNCHPYILIEMCEELLEAMEAGKTVTAIVQAACGLASCPCSTEKSDPGAKKDTLYDAT
eukprot:5378232-Amphidinium_carterae.1